MANAEIEFWTDEYFFKSQDPAVRELEKRRHPDTGKRIPIVLGRQADYVLKLAVQEAAGGKQEETQVVYWPTGGISKN